MADAREDDAALEQKPPPQQGLTGSRSQNGILIQALLTYTYTPQSGFGQNRMLYIKNGNVRGAITVGAWRARPRGVAGAGGPV